MRLRKRLGLAPGGALALTTVKTGYIHYNMKEKISEPYLGSDIFSEEKTIHEARKLVVPSFETTVEELTPELIGIPD